MPRIAQDIVLVNRTIKKKDGTQKKVWHFRLKGEGKLKSAGTTKKYEAQKKAEQAWADYQKNHGIYLSVPTLREYIDEKGFYLWDKCPHIADVKSTGKKTITERTAYNRRKILEKYVFGIADFADKPLSASLTVVPVCEITVVGPDKSLELLPTLRRQDFGQNLLSVPCR